MASQERMSLVEFMERYATEDACEKQLFSMKWPNGYICERCGHNAHFTVTTRRLSLFTCKNCRYQATVTVGTVMEKTRTDLRKWFLAIYMVATDKRGVSGMQLTRDLGISYPTAWTMLQKIRSAIGEHDARYKLGGIVEVDDTYFGGPDTGGKHGRGTDKTQVAVGVSLTEDGRPLYAKMEVIPNLNGEILLDFARRNIVPGATIRTDALRVNNKLAESFSHEPHPFDPNGDHLKWLHIIVSNAKAFIQGTFHGLDDGHLQRYLNEFCYRLNRRFFQGQGFLRLLSCCATSPPMTYRELVL